MKFTADDAKIADLVDVDIEDESVLADGMIPDSRIVKLIDELEIINDDFNNEGNLDKNALESLGLC